MKDVHKRGGGGEGNSSASSERRGCNGQSKVVESKDEALCLYDFGAGGGDDGRKDLKIDEKSPTT